MDELNNWKNQNYIKGVLAGVLVGLISAYLFNRSSEEEILRTGKKENKISTGRIIGVSLTTLGLMRQIAELNKDKS